MSNLDNPQFRKDLAKEILRRIDEYCVKIYDDDHRWHLGASIIGKVCPRAIWYSFRWVYKEVFSGRMLRLFNRGHREEPKLTEYLKGIGFRFTDILTDGKQELFSAIAGHYGGSKDEGGILPPDFGIEEKILVEFKTKKTGGEFNELKKKGVRFCNWQHFVQMSTYGKYFGLRYALYFVVNKNDDEISLEVVQLDWQVAEDKTRVAKDIIEARQAPNRVAASKAYSECKRCVYSPICWDNVEPEKNCRSCWKAKPVDNGEWFCEQYENVIPRDFVKQGCDNWEPVK